MKFLLDLAKIIFATLIIGQFISSGPVNWTVFFGAMITLALLVGFSGIYYRAKKKIQIQEKD